MSNEPMLMMMQAAPAGGSGGIAGVLIGILPWVAIFGIFYFLMIRPQQQRVKQHQAEIAAVKKGDDVITGGGIRGRVTKVFDDEAEIDLSDDSGEDTTLALLLEQRGWDSNYGSAPDSD